MASNAAGKKGKKAKGKVLSLQSFLGNDGGAVKAGFSIVTTKKKDWAAEVEADGGYDDSMDMNYKPGEQFVLPSGPMGPNVDMSKVPTSPPFTAFMGNLAFDIEKEDIEDFFKGLRVTSIRLPRAPEGQVRVRGFGYVEFDDRESLLEALAMNEKHLKSGRVKIDVADNQGDNYDPRRRDNKDRGFGGGPDRTGGDWRAAPREESSSGRPERNFRDGDRDGGGGGGGSRDGGSRFGGERNYDRGFRSSAGPPEAGSDRGFRSSGGGAAFADRGPPGERSEGGERTAFTNFRSSSSRFNNESSDRDGGRSGGRRDFGGGGFRSEGGGSDYGSRFGRSGGSGSNYERNDRDPEPSANSEDGPSERPRLNLQPRTRPLEETAEHDAGHERPERAERAVVADAAPSERPRLVLQPRTKPVAAEEEGGATVTAASRPSIFGGAKPVDTAAREREIEQRLAKERTEMPSMRAASDIRLRENAAPREAPREDHADRREPPAGEESSSAHPVGQPRKARTTSSSSGGGRSPHTSGGPVTLVSTRHSSATSEPDEEKLSAPAPAAKQQPPSPRREDVVVVPAPPPKENVWAKRSASVQQAPPNNSEGRTNANHDKNCDAQRSNSVNSDSDQRQATRASNVIQVGK